MEYPLALRAQPLPEPGTALATRPYTPNFTMGGTPPPKPGVLAGLRSLTPQAAGAAVGNALRSPLARASLKLGGAAAVLDNMNDYKIDDPSVDSSAKGTLRALGSGDFTGAARSASKGALEAGMDVGSFVANTADLFVPGKAPVSTAYDRALRSQFGDQLISNRGAPPVGGDPNYGNEGRNYRAATPPPPPAAPPGGANPNYSNEGRNYPTPVTAPAAPMTAGVSNLRGGYDADAAERVSEIERKNSGLRRELDLYGPGASAGITGITYDPGNDKRDREQALSKLESTSRLARSGYERAQAAGAYAKLASEGANNQAEKIAAINAASTARGQNNGLRIAELNNDTARRSNDQNNETVRRGQDLTAATNRAANRVALMKEQRDQANKDREFAFNSYKLGEELDGKDTDRRMAGVKALHDEIGSMLPPGPDGKPDTATAARYAAGMNQLLAERQAAAEAHLKRNPNDAVAKSFLEGVRKNGVNALTDLDKRKFIAGMQANDLAEQNHSSLNPWGGTRTGSQGPVAGLRYRPGLISDDYETLGVDGRVTGVIPARAVDRPGSVLGLGGRRDTTYDILKQPR